MARSLFVRDERSSLLRDVTVAFVVSRLVFYATALLAGAVLTEQTGRWYIGAGLPDLIEASWRWDSEWYWFIARHGYVFDPPGFSTPAFFPLLPAVLWVLHAIVGEPAVFTVAVVLNHAVVALALAAVWQYASATAGPEVARRTVLLIALFPTGMFFATVYTESYFLLFSAIALLALHRRRVGISSGAAALVTLTRPVGLLIAVPLAMLGRRLPERSGLVPISAVAVAALTFVAVVGVATGSVTAFLSAQESWPGGPTVPLLPVLGGIRFLWTFEGFTFFHLLAAVNVASVVGALFLGIRLWESDRPGAAYSLVTIAVVASIAGPLGAPAYALGRYLVVLFPLFVELGRRTSSPTIYRLTLSGFAVLFVVYTAGFVAGYPVV